MRNKNRVVGRLARMRELYARLCGGWGGRTERLDSAGVRLPNPPVQLAAMPSSEQGGTKAAQRAQAATDPIRSGGVFGGLRLRGPAGMRSNAANSGATYGLRGLAGVRSTAVSGGTTYGLRELAGMRSNAASGGATYGLRGLAGMQPNAASGGATYGLRELAGMQSDVASGGATYGMRGTAGMQSNATNSGATYVMRGLAGVRSSAASGGVTYGLRGWSGVRRTPTHGEQAVRRLAPPRLLGQTVLFTTHTRGENPANGWREMAGARAAQTVARPTSRHETFGLRGLAGVRPAQQSLWNMPPAPPLRIPSPLPDKRQGTDAAAAQVQVVVTNNCKIETPVDYQTVWNKLEDALRESLSVVAAGG